MTQLLAVEPVLPEFRYAQEELTDALVEIIGLDERAERAMRRIHAGCEVDYRHLALPIERYAALVGFGQSNDAFIEAAVDLGAQALVGALDRAGLRPADVDLIVSVTITGLAVPSLTVQRDDASPANLVASGLFGDGACAVVAVGHDHPRVGVRAGPRVIASASRLYPGTAEVMGWQVGGTGLRIVLGPEVPDLVRDQVGADVRTFLAGHGMTTDDVGWWVCHPGGPKVIGSLAATLGVSRGALELTTESLRTVGNLSSSSVLHILRTALDRGPEPGSRGVMMAMGPGFGLELVLLEA